MKYEHHSPDLGDRIRSIRGAVALIIGAIAACGLMVLALHLSSDGIREDFAGERYLADLSFDLQFLDYVVLDVKVDLLEQAASSQILGFGDSSCQFGFSPAALGGAAHMSALNLGTFGTVGAQGHVAMLEAALAAGSTPRAVVLWLHPHTLVQSDAEIASIGHLEWLTGRLDGRPAHSANLLASSNDTVGGGMRLTVLDHAGWRREMLHEHLTPAEVRERLLADRGWFAAVRQETRSVYASTRIHEDALGGLAKFNAVCVREGLPSFLAIMPRVGGGSISENDHAELVRQIHAAVPNARLLQSMPAEVSWRDMQSPTHFARDLADSVSALLGAEIAERLAP